MLAGLLLLLANPLLLLAYLLFLLADLLLLLDGPLPLLFQLQQPPRLVPFLLGPWPPLYLPSFYLCPLYLPLTSLACKKKLKLQFQKFVGVKIKTCQGNIEFGHFMNGDV